MRKSLLGHGALILLLAWPRLEAVAQDIPAIAGTVVDPTGSAINGAKITVIEDSTGRTYETATDCGGAYRLANLAPGSYSVRFEKKAFRPETRSSVHVSLSQVAQVNSKLQVGVFGGSGPEIMAEGVPVEVGPTGTIRGTVTDPKGTAVPARIWAFESSSEKHYTSTTTDSDGVYRLRDLPPGSCCLAYEAGDWGSGARNAVLVSSSQATTENIHLPARSEKVEVCTGSCMIEIIEASAPSPGIALHLYAESNVATPGSPLWLTVVLTNRAKYPVLIQTEDDPNSAFGYQIYAWGSCSCPAELRRRDNGTGPEGDKQLANIGSGPGTIRVPRDGTLIKRIDLSKLMNLSPADPFGPTYILQVRRHDTSKAKNGQEVKDRPVVRSNTILVTVMAPR